MTEEGGLERSYLSAWSACQPATRTRALCARKVRDVEPMSGSMSSSPDEVSSGPAGQ